MHDYDIILGTDWLWKHYAKIYFKKKKVTFRPSQKESFTFKGECKENKMSIISTLKEARLLNGGCDRYLACVVIETQEQISNLKDISMVNEFHEVFPEKLTRLPPNREIEFKIDLLTRTAPISKALYKMSPPELKELKSQLQELLDKATYAQAIHHEKH